jgi:hypothetical protein
MDKKNLERIELALKLHAPKWAGTTDEMATFGLPDFLVEVGKEVGDPNLEGLVQDMIAKEVHHRQVSRDDIHLVKEERELAPQYSYEWWCDYEVLMVRDPDYLYNNSRVVNHFVWSRLLKRAGLTAETIPADAMLAILTFDLINITHPRLRPTGRPYRLVRAFGPF